MIKGGTKRKRAVHACVPCYSKKQKCNRQYPCNHCTRRRRPELCEYIKSPSNTSPSASTSRVPLQQPGDASTSDNVGEQAQSENFLRVDSGAGSSSRDSSARQSPATAIDAPAEDSLADLFGYYEDSETNILGLLRRFGVDETRPARSDDDADLTLSAEFQKGAKRALDDMPPRHVLDFVIQYFFKDVNWISQLVYPPAFLAQYEQWWTTTTTTNAPSRLPDVEFAALILRISAYTTLQLPAPSCPVDPVAPGWSLARLRRVCADLGDQLGELCRTCAPDHRSLCRIQHMAFAGLRGTCDGPMRRAWESLGKGIAEAQAVGLHREPPADSGMDAIEKEWRRRIFCNLYIWDSCLSRNLDRMPFLVPEFCTTEEPKMHLPIEAMGGGGGGGGALQGVDIFTERVLSLRLWRFWNSVQPRSERAQRAQVSASSSASAAASAYDPLAAEERYARFCTEFLPALPPAFVVGGKAPLAPWDDKMPTLAKQREFFHLAVFDSICYNYKHLLHLTPDQARALPRRQRDLLARQRGTLARATLASLESSASLHALYGAEYTRASVVTMYTFEAAVLLACLCLSNITAAVNGFEVDDGEDDDDNAGNPLVAPWPAYSDPLRSRGLDTSPASCLRALERARRTLEILSEGFQMAQAGAKRLTRLIETLRSSFREGPHGPPVPLGHGAIPPSEGYPGVPGQHHFGAASAAPSFDNVPSSGPLWGGPEPPHFRIGTSAFYPPPPPPQTSGIPDDMMMGVTNDSWPGLSALDATPVSQADLSPFPFESAGADPASLGDLFWSGSRYPDPPS